MGGISGWTLCNRGMLGAVALLAWTGATPVALAEKAPQALAQQTSVTVAVDGVASDRGTVLVAICTEDTFLKRDACPYRGSAPAQAGTVTVTLSGVAPGTYAVQAFHDENDNRDLDRDWLGRPKEGMGFGNDAAMRRGPPAFEAAAISVASPQPGATPGSIKLTLRYFDRR